jgi:hypothetical protein
MRNVLAVLIVSVACGGSTDPVVVVDGSVTKITLDDAYLGGAVGHCYSQYPTVSYDRGTRSLTVTACTDAAPSTNPATRNPVTLTNTTRVLSPGEASDVEASLATIKASGNQQCGGMDGQDYRLSTFDAVNHERKYSAHDINCYGNEQVTGLSGAYVLLVGMR